MHAHLTITDHETGPDDSRTADMNALPSPNQVTTVDRTRPSRSGRFLATARHFLLENRGSTGAVNIATPDLMHTRGQA
jgi:hypothetical protein